MSEEIDKESPEYLRFKQAKGKAKRAPRLGGSFGKKLTGKNVYEEALDRMRVTFDLFDNVGVSFSGGKDSTAALQVALAVAREKDRLPLKVFFVDEETATPSTVEYVERVSQDPDVDLYWIAIPLQHRGGYSSEEPSIFPWAREDRHKWLRTPPEQAIVLEDIIDWYQDPMGLDGKSGGDPLTRPSLSPIANMFFRHAFPTGSIAQVLGIRVDESFVRRKAIANATSHVDHFIKRRSNSRLAKVYPIYDWKVADIWTAAAQFGWDYNEMYDLMEMQGIAPNRQRVGNFFGSEGLRDLDGLSELFPEHYEKFLDRFKGVRTVAMYAHTELYGYGEKVVKPEGTSWPDYIKEIAASSHKTEVARKDALFHIGRLVRRHYRVTNEPILEVPHYQSGLSWGTLVRIARQGDGKNRIASQMMVYPPTFEEYSKALKEYRKDLRAKRSSNK